MKSTTSKNRSAIVICDGLINSRINASARFANKRTNLGNREIERLIGYGRGYGKGPLPHLLSEVVKVSEPGTRMAVIILHDKPVVDKCYQGNEEDWEFPYEIRDVCNRSIVIETSPKKVPWEELLSAINAIRGDEGGINAATKLPQTQFLIVGSHTEGRPLAIATHLKNALGDSRVAVCSHLIGSRERESHFAALRHIYTLHGVEVLLSLRQAFDFVGIMCSDDDLNNHLPCKIEPPEIKELLGESQRRIVELLCLHWTKCILHPLTGGFSGSFLFVAEGWKQESRTEPMVLKIDNFMQMRREIFGYNEVKDLLGKHIPLFGYPVEVGDNVGVGMELATMEGKPETLQNIFEEADYEDAFTIFLQRFERALSLISVKLYDNTKENEGVNPYHRLGLSSPRERGYLKENAGFIAEYLSDYPDKRVSVQIERLPQILNLVTDNTDGISSETCIVHGDLNLQNIICDNMDNVWFIDWTHCGRQPLELDFAKLENDIKFVISKDFGLEDLENLRKFEEYLISEKLPVEEKKLPEHLKFVKWDLRFRKIYSAIRLVRRACFSLKKTEQWIVYRAALLKYSLHTLSFDKRRDRGECGIEQLTYALHSTELLLLNLITDDFHLKIRGEKPASYPPRQRISIDYAPWRIDCPDYDPPYYVSPNVLTNWEEMADNGWADPEDVEQSAEKKQSVISELKYDKKGRPLHPNGRTGISGRGLLGRWGPNPAVNAVILRMGATKDEVEILLGKKTGVDVLSLPEGFVGRRQSSLEAIREIVNREFGIRLPGQEDIIYEGFYYDKRQTDNAWVEISSFLFIIPNMTEAIKFDLAREYEEVNWFQPSDEVMETVHPGHAKILRLTFEILKDKRLLNETLTRPSLNA